MDGIEQWIWRMGISPILVFTFSVARSNIATHATLSVGIFKCHVSFGMSLEN